VKTLDEPHIVCDPTKVLCNFFFFSNKYTSLSNLKVDGLMRARAMSYYWQYPSCPAVSWLCYAVLKKTRGIKALPDGLSYHRKQAFNDIVSTSTRPGERKPFYLIPPTTGTQTRCLVQQLFGWSIADQMSFEQSCEEWAEGLSENITPPPHLVRQYQDYAYCYVDTCAARPYRPWNKSSALRDPTPFLRQIMFGLEFHQGAEDPTVRTQKPNTQRNGNPQKKPIRAKFSPDYFGALPFATEWQYNRPI
jgi:hypothetical protein